MKNMSDGTARSDTILDSSTDEEEEEGGTCYCRGGPVRLSFFLSFHVVRTSNHRHSSVVNWPCRTDERKGGGGGGQCRNLHCKRPSI